MKFSTSSKSVQEATIFYGLNELQQHFLREEIRKDHRRSASTLRRIAKKKAIVQRFKWLLGDFMTMVAMVGIVAAIILSMFVIFYQG